MLEEKEKLIYKKIIVKGVVQGVGFRPTIYRLAKKLNIYGFVKNSVSCVEISVCCSYLSYAEMLNTIKYSLSPPIIIDSVQSLDISPFDFDSFTISESISEYNRSISSLPADQAFCHDCRIEFFDREDRRFGYPFITCNTCGPRYTITSELPFDRENTSMSSFPMCSLCQDEYSDPNNRRYHSQTISCPVCGPKLFIHYQGSVHFENALASAISYIKSGAIISVKGLGGYHLICSPHDHIAVSNLRRLKNRDSKPFALMFKDIETIRKYCHMDSNEEKLLLSSEAPICILNRREDVTLSIPLVSSIDCTLAVFIPYTPIHTSILQEFDMLVVTSANLEGDEIITDMNTMCKFTLDAKYNIGIDIPILSHNRDIIRENEDSVVQNIQGNSQLLRRSRGYIPRSISINQSRKVLALGGDINSSFCVADLESGYISEPFGDLKNFSSFIRYKNTLKSYSSLLGILPEKIACDMHPGYLSLDALHDFDLEYEAIQHHHAHIASVMAENSISNEVIGVAFDGSGYGSDGAIWGGEFLLCSRESYTRVGHLTYKKNFNGEFIRDIKKLSNIYLLQNDIYMQEVKDLDVASDIALKALNNNINTHNSSSMGRLFDCISGILKLSDYNYYEGYAAIKLQDSALKAIKRGVKALPLEFSITKKDNCYKIDFNELVFRCYKNCSNIESVALGFHIACANLVYNMCRNLRDSYNINDIILSGGVFQNSLLLSLILDKLKISGFNYFINRIVPPNDYGLSLGQAYICGV